MLETALFYYLFFANSGVTNYLVNLVELTLQSLFQKCTTLNSDRNITATVICILAASLF